MKRHSHNSKKSTNNSAIVLLCCHFAVPKENPRTSLFMDRGHSKTKNPLSTHFLTKRQTRPEASTRCHAVSLRWSGTSLLSSTTSHVFSLLSSLFFLAVHYRALFFRGISTRKRGRVMATTHQKDIKKNTPALGPGPLVNSPRQGKGEESHTTEQRDGLYGVLVHKCSKK